MFLASNRDSYHKSNVSTKKVIENYFTNKMPSFTNKMPSFSSYPEIKKNIRFIH
jgi:hypothetical protein